MMTPTLVKALFLAHLGATLFMVAIIWFVQTVHYPLFSSVGSQTFSTYEQRHTSSITLIVAPAMLLEVATALLLFWYRPMEISPWSLTVGLTLLIVIWLSTFLIQVPSHNKLSSGFDAAVHAQLVWTNWIRTAAWSLRGILVLWMTWVLLR